MTDMRKNDLRPGRRMLAVYKEKDAAIRKLAEAGNSSCSKGCSDCCSMLVNVTFPEAMAIADYVCTSGKFLETQGFLDRAATLMHLQKSFYDQLGTIAEAAKRKQPGYYFTQKKPCVFLDAKTKACKIYEVRPSACRIHHVSSAPSACAPDSGEAQTKIDMSAIAHYMDESAWQSSKQSNLPLWVGPLQVMVIWAIKLYLEGRDSVALAHGEKLGILDLNLWRFKNPNLEVANAEEAEEDRTVPGVSEAGRGDGSGSGSEAQAEARIDR